MQWYNHNHEPDPDVAAGRGAVGLYLPCMRHKLIMSSHKSIIAYLSAKDLTDVASKLKEEFSIGDSFDAATTKKYEGLLVKKWTSIVRLQRKVEMPFKALWTY